MISYAVTSCFGCDSYIITEANHLSTCNLKKMEYAREELLNEIEEIKRSLETAHSNFENACDPDLVDSCIYEVNAIQYRYQYLLKEMRKVESLSKSQA